MNIKNSLVLLVWMPVIQALDNIEILKQYVRANPVVVEAGAHKGTDTVKLSALWPEGTIHAFEPVPELFEDLKNATAQCANVKVYQLALAAQTGTAAFYVSKVGTGSSSLLEPKEHLQQFPDIIFPFTIEVPTINLDEWMARENIATIDVLWLDLQGTEYNVLTAAPEVLKHVRVIATEVNFKELYAGCVLYPIYKAWLEQQGFVQVFIERPHPSWGDAVFVRR